MTSNSNDNRYIVSAIDFISKNKLLFIGLFLGVLIVLPTTLYVKQQNSNQQIDPPSSTLETKSDKNAQNQDFTSVKPQSVPVQSPEQSSNRSSQSSQGGDYTVTEECREVITPYKTYTENDSWLYVGETSEYGEGIDGVDRVCTHTNSGADWGKYRGLKFDVTSALVDRKDKWVSIGTKPIPSSSSSNPTYTQEQATQMAISTCSPIAQASGTNSSSYQSCITTALRSYGY